VTFRTFIDVTCSFKGVTGGFHFLPVGRGRLLAMPRAWLANQAQPLYHPRTRPALNNLVAMQAGDVALEEIE